MKAKQVKDISAKIGVFLNYLFSLLIFANIAMDLYFVGQINYGPIVFLVIALIFNHVIY